MAETQVAFAEATISKLTTTSRRRRTATSSSTRRGTRLPAGATKKDPKHKGGAHSASPGCMESSSDRERTSASGHTTST